MARPDDVSFGADFDADGFREAILSTMQMGKSPEQARQATFVFASPGRSYVKNGVTLTAPPRLDMDGRPFDPDVAVVEVPGRELQVDCAVEIGRADTEESAVGTLRRTKATVTLLDDQYAQVKDCRELRYNGDRYVFGYSPEGLGLFDVGVYTMIFYALDEAR